jgi:hypothetical protein
MAQLPLPIGNPEFNDGLNWYALASENWVVNNARKLKPCEVATTENLIATYNTGSSGIGATLTHFGAATPLSIDVVNLSVGNRVLVKNQTASSTNGIYVVTNSGSTTVNWILTRTDDFDSVNQMVRGDVVDVVNGAKNRVSAWMLTSIVSAVGPDPIEFARLSGVHDIFGTQDEIEVTISDGIATISLATDPIIPGNGAMRIPTGNTTERPAAPRMGLIRYNSSL